MFEFILRVYLSSYSKFRKAFTLPELLLGVFIALLLLGSLLSVLINLLIQERNEQILTETQQNMERAMRFMAEDIRQAVYVYDFQQTPSNTGSTGTYTNGKGLPYPLVGIPSSLIAANYIPIIAFWKITPLTDGVLTGLNCGALSNSSYIPENNPQIANGALSSQGECNALLYRRKMMSLVVYFQKINAGDSSDSSWRGKSRILRYQFDKYNPSTTPTTRNAGFIDPTYSSNYANWPENNSQTNLQSSLPTTTSNNLSVLIDYVDDPKSTVDTKFPACDSSQTRIPDNLSTASYSTSFYVCVTTLSAQSAQGNWSSPAGQNQVVSIYLRGNAQGFPGLQVITGTNNNVLAPLFTKVNIRGVINENY